MEKTFTNSIDGYWRDINKSGLPSHSGVYFVYSCIYNSNTNSVDIKKLLYIGESINVNNRVSNHEKYEDWKSYLNNGEELCFSTCPVESYYRERVEAAYIYKHKPPVNTEYIYDFPFDNSTIISTGKTSSLNPHFTV